MRSTSHQTSFVMPTLVPTESAIDKDQHNFVHLKLTDHKNGCGATFAAEQSFWIDRLWVLRHDFEALRGWSYRI